jgi:large subunit ribosomal protein L21
MAYAVIKTGGKQYRVSVGDKLDVERLEADEGSTINFGEVLAAGEGDSIRFGAPFLGGASVSAKVLNQFKGEKVIAFKFRRRKGYHRKKGHRQLQTKVEITGINA